MTRDPAPILAALAERGPLPPLLQRVFDGEPPLPMKIGIRDDFTARYPDVSKTKLRRLMKLIAKSEAYWRECLAPGATRHDLDEQPTEPVSEADRAYIETRLARLAARKARAIEPPAPPPKLGPNGRPILGLRK